MRTTANNSGSTKAMVKGTVSFVDTVPSPPMDKPERPADQRRERTREQILHATRAALVRVGFENITTRLIAEEAGVNIATLHYYFGTKEALLSETVRYPLQQFEARIRAATQEAPDTATALEKLFGMIWEIVQERGGVLRYDLLVRGLRDDTARADVNVIYGVFRAIAREVVERHIKSGGTLPSNVSEEAMAHYLVATMDGIVLQFVLNGDEVMTAQSLTLAKHSALALMGAQASGTATTVTGVPTEKSADKSGPEEETR